MQLNDLGKRDVNIVSNIIESVGTDWSKIVAYMEYGEDTYWFEYYIKYEGKYIRYDKVTYLDKAVVENAFEKVYQLVAESKEDTDFYRRVLTVVIDNVKHEFTVKTDGYNDGSRDRGIYRYNWIRNYLV